MTSLLDLGRAVATDRDIERFRRAWDALSPDERVAVSAHVASLVRAAEDPTPGDLAMRLDPLTVQTPALAIIDAQLMAVRDRVTVMLARRQLFAAYTRDGMPDDEAIEATVLAVPDAGLDRLIVSMPPQEGKSWRISRFGVLWLLRQFPALAIVLASYDGGNASQFSYAVRADIDLFDGTQGNPDLGLRLARDQKAMSRWTLSTGGGIFAIGIGGGLTGHKADLLIIDDPVKDYRAADSLLLSQQAWDWWQTVARPRLSPWAPVVEVQTRWHELDLAGRMMTKQAEDEARGEPHFDRWHVVNIAAECESTPDILGREVGEFMVSARGRTREQWLATKVGTTPRFWSALYQGSPAPGTGEVWLAEWWRRYESSLVTQRGDGTFACEPGYDLAQSWDMAFKGTDGADFVVCTVWAKRGSESYLVYVLRRRMTFTQTLDAFRRVTRLFPQAKRKYVEAKANGEAIVDSLRKEIPGIILSNPDWGDKVARADATSPFVRAGNVLVPTDAVAALHPDIAWEPEVFIAEATSFPRGQHDDQVDSASQYLAETYLGSVGPSSVLVAPGTIAKRGSSINPSPLRGMSEMQRRLAERALAVPHANGDEGYAPTNGTEPTNGAP